MEETYSHDGPTCPHCGHVQQPEEASFYDDDRHDEECGECGKSYSWTYYRSDSWTAVPTGSNGP